jgi:hypothetical protein
VLNVFEATVRLFHNANNLVSVTKHPVLPHELAVLNEADIERLSNLGKEHLHDGHGIRFRRREGAMLECIFHIE